MSTTFSRRVFGLMTLGAAAVAAPRLALAQPGAFANPHLLMEPGELMGAVSSISAAGQSALDDGIAVIDVRPREEYAAGHIPGARHLDRNAVVATQSPVDGTLMGIDDLEALLGAVGVSADRRIAFYDDLGGFHAARMLWLMEYLGHRNVSVLHGGWSGWLAAGGPVQRQVEVGDVTLFQSALSPRRHATAEDVLAHRNAPGAVLIDVRPPHLFEEGHIPWAINIPWSQNLGEDNRFLMAEALLAHFEAHGVTPGSDVIMHCQVGLASAHSYLALRLLGFPRVRVYHRSWAEWGGDPDLPKAVG